MADRVWHRVPSHPFSHLVHTAALVHVRQWPDAMVLHLVLQHGWGQRRGSARALLQHASLAQWQLTPALAQPPRAHQGPGLVPTVAQYSSERHTLLVVHHAQLEDPGQPQPGKHCRARRRHARSKPMRAGNGTPAGAHCMPVQLACGAASAARRTVPQTGLPEGLGREQDALHGRGGMYTVSWQAAAAGAQCQHTRCWQSLPVAGAGTVAAARTRANSSRRWVSCLGM